MQNQPLQLQQEIQGEQLFVKIVDFGLLITFEGSRICFSNHITGQIFGGKISEILAKHLSIASLEVINDDF